MVFALSILESRGIGMVGKRQKKKIAALIVLSIFTVLVLFPLGWMLSTSLKLPKEAYKIPPSWIPEAPTFKNYLDAWHEESFGRYFLNSSIVALLTAFVATMVATLAGYGLARYRFKNKRLFIASVLMTQMFPGVLLIIPFFNWMRIVGLLNTYFALIFAYTSFTLPFTTWIIYGFFKQIPSELDEAVMIDGGSRFTAFWRVSVPLVKPGILAIFLFAFLLGWSEYLFALALTIDPEMYVITVGIAALKGQYKILWTYMMSMGILAILPIILLFVFLEKHLVKGLTTGAISG